MLQLFIWGVIFIISLFVLIKSADYFTSSVSRIGSYLKIPGFILGATIVAISTSLPELISGIFAVMKNSSEIVIGNVIGANIANIFLVLGIASLFSKKSLKIKNKLIFLDLTILALASVLLAISIWNGIFAIFETFIFIFFLILYFIYTSYIQHQRNNHEKIKLPEREKKKIRRLRYKTLLIPLISLIFIYIGAKYTVESIIMLSGILNIGKAIIAATAVSIGTTLPELMVSISAVKKGKLGIAIGNIIGSNIFNIFGVMGIAGLFGTIIIPKTIINFALPMMLIATFVFFLISYDKKITKTEGFLLLIFYIFFLIKSFNIF